MSILFGIRQPQGRIVEEPELRRMASTTNNYAEDGTFVKASGRVGMGFQPYYTHERSTMGEQPAISDSGDMLSFDGRLDNYSELCHALDLPDAETPDSLIVLEAFRRWNDDCFSRLIGDWALVLWSHELHSLYLARDHAGTRTLYYRLADGSVKWSSYLETLVGDKNAAEPDETFAAAYLSCLPIGDLTPYKGVRAVSAAHFVVIHEEKVVRTPHWRSMVQIDIHYDSDADYDEHFLSLFRQSVARRTGPGAPVLAELSGGMDSSSIVCMSDRIRQEQGAAPSDLVDTVSYYDDSEPNWNEKPYFTLVERARGKRGLHIEALSQNRKFGPPAPQYLWPGPESCTLAAERQLEHQLGFGQYRAILSGIGGDELLGGPPNPLPELADLLVTGNIRKLISEAFQWCVAKREPLIHLLYDTTALVAALYTRPQPRRQKAPPWLSAVLLEQSAKLRFRELSGGAIGHLPSAVDSGLTWCSIIETLPRPFQRVIVRREYRYPFLDRDMVDFLIRIPANQLMRPGRRRLLMRRALRGIVPAEVLERRRKAYVARGVLVALSNNKSHLTSLFRHSLLGSIGYVKEEALRSAVTGLDAPVNTSQEEWLMRAIKFELWMGRSSGELRSNSFGLDNQGDKDPCAGQSAIGAA
jgi:asparagine synthase (glutamine-hydrolysing)